VPLSEFLAVHGFHGPQENEVSGLVWREDDAPLRRLIGRYRDMDEASSPLAGAAERLAERDAAEQRLLAGLSAPKRLGVRVLLKLARRYVPLREVGRDSFLKGMDVVRYAARIIGGDLQRHGLIDQPDDAFYLTPVELTELPDGLHALVALRRERRKFYEGVELPERWRGHVEPHAKAVAGGITAVKGIGVSAGVAEGLVRVVLDPSADELEEGEILVCRTTDPGWASYFFLASGVVIDIGGALSHGAIIAREMGLPCVINARNATEQLGTGDRVRIDGTAGTVEVLERNVVRRTA
jgi:pyruvate,water dikinase